MTLDDKPVHSIQADKLPVKPAEITNEEVPEKSKLNVVEMAITFVSPALFTKLLLLYFGSMYSSHPGEGYGIGLSITIVFTVVMLGRFVWRYRDYSED